MANDDFPLLLFPIKAAVDKRDPGSGGPDKNNILLPSPQRQGERLTPKFDELANAIEAQRVSLSASAPAQDPEFVLVLEIIGKQDDFYKAVKNLEADWLFEFASELAQDEDFRLDDDQATAFLRGRMFLVGTNQRALKELLSLWRQYQTNPSVSFARGLAPLKHVFTHLRDLRRWDVQDRVDDNIRSYWEDEVSSGQLTSRFEIEAWYFSTTAKNTSASNELARFIADAGGQILQNTLIPEIAYHGFLVELPTTKVAEILAGDYPSFVLSDRVMFFRPRAQCISDGSVASEPVKEVIATGKADLRPIVALLDGLPLANHGLLQGRLQIDDPDDWASNYAAKDRVHGTAMASLILHGELDGAPVASKRKLYVRPIMKPNDQDGSQRRSEQTPDDTLLIDLVHRAVRRMFEANGSEPPAAPTIKIVNLSIGNSHHLFGEEISPWARLIDWLSEKYSILFMISAGNDPSSLNLDIRRDEFTGSSQGDKQSAALKSLLANSVTRRLMSPAESINALTIGAIHSDTSSPKIPPTRFDLFAHGSVSAISRIGHGFGRSIKPDILMPGGRILHSAYLKSPPELSIMNVAMSTAAPGHLVARPPLGGTGLNETEYCRGTSNATALASRTAAMAYDVIELLRSQGADLQSEYDAVLIKAMLVHGAEWGDLSKNLLDHGPSFANFAHGATRELKKKDFVARWLGYGVVNSNRLLTCASNRATLIGVGQVGKNKAIEFSAPKPPGLASVVTWRRMTVTLAWISPTNASLQKYRKAKLWIDPPKDFDTQRKNTPSYRMVQRGTVQHEVWEGDSTALAFIDGDKFVCKVNCMEDAPGLTGDVRFALCVSLEVPIESGIEIYKEIRDRAVPPVSVKPG